jgi:general secretion pathway protein B
MSLILDALKKLEQEKATRRARQVEIRPALTGRKNAPSSAPWRLPALIAGAVILAVVVTMVVMERFSSQNIPAVPAPVRQESPRPMEPSSAVTNPSPVTTVPVQSPLTVPASPPAPPQILSPVTAPPSSPQRPGTVVPEPTGPAPADLKVTGIAWQDERPARRAVVNGALAGEGAVVSGARVVEIRQDQVRFSRDGQTFSVQITSSNR